MRAIQTKQAAAATELLFLCVPRHELCIWIATLQELCAPLCITENSQRFHRIAVRGTDMLLARFAERNCPCALYLHLDAEEEIRITNPAFTQVQIQSPYDFTPLERAVAAFDDQSMFLHANASTGAAPDAAAASERRRFLLVKGYRMLLGTYTQTHAHTVQGGRSVYPARGNPTLMIDPARGIVLLYFKQNREVLSRIEWDDVTSIDANFLLMYMEWRTTLEEGLSQGMVLALYYDSEGSVLSGFFHSMEHAHTWHSDYVVSAQHLPQSLLLCNPLIW